MPTYKSMVGRMADANKHMSEIAFMAKYKKHFAGNDITLPIINESMKTYALCLMQISEEYKQCKAVNPVVKASATPK